MLHGMNNALSASRYRAGRLIPLAMRWLLSLLCLSFVWHAYAQSAAQMSHGKLCDSCQIYINSLDQPHPLTGLWLFSRDDQEQNKNVDLDTTLWRLVKTPGSWKHAYDDGVNFKVGWYRATFEFAPSLVGQEVVLLLNTYMGRVTVYVDGREVYRRPHNINVERYYAAQAIPVRFTITQPHQVVAIRVDTPLMTGIYQLPFELRRYDSHDLALVGYQILGGEARQITAYVFLAFGLFFLLVYAKTRYPLYLVSALCSIVFVPFLAALSDMFMGIFEPETMLYLHYLGIFVAYLFFLFSQFFHRPMPRLNWWLGVPYVVLALTIAAMAIHPNLDLFQKIRGIYFLFLPVAGVFACYNFWRGARAGKPGAMTLVVWMTLFLLTALNDVLLSLGVLTTISLTFVGGIFAISAMLYVTSNIFANTFVENRNLARNLRGLNENLEEMVAQRTSDLEAANQRLAEMAVKDELTGAYNRRHFNSVFKAELSRRSRPSAPMAFCILDVDKFKQYNDHYGHLAGDVVLQSVSEAVRGQLRRAGDEFFRLGGEEFGILLIGNQDPEVAKAFVEGVRATIEGLAIPHELSERGVVTASFGLVILVGGSQATACPEDVYCAADALLYEAKAQGRNCVVAKTM